MSENTNRKPDGASTPSKNIEMNKTTTNMKPFLRKTVKTTRFEGRCDELKSVIFDVVDSNQKQAENFTRAMRELSIYVSKE